LSVAWVQSPLGRNFVSLKAGRQPENPPSCTNFDLDAENLGRRVPRARLQFGKPRDGSSKGRRGRFAFLAHFAAGVGHFGLGPSGRNSVLLQAGGSLKGPQSAQSLVRIPRIQVAGFRAAFVGWVERQRNPSMAVQRGAPLDGFRCRSSHPTHATRLIGFKESLYSPLIGRRDGGRMFIRNATANRPRRSHRTMI